MLTRRIQLRFLFLILVASLSFAQSSGRIAGRVTNASGAGVGGVAVIINELSRATTTDSQGSYRFDAVPAGTYSLTFTAAEETEVRSGVTVAGGQTTPVDQSVTWTLTFADAITVYSASRRTERIVEAPAAVTVVSEDELELVSATGQLPKVLEYAPGVDFTQSGLYDFNFNTRGFNSSLNRRILTLIDGRDPSVAFLGAQEWAALSYPIDEMATVELVRGPGAALYGPNAFNGVLNMVTKRPSQEPGGKLQLSGGELGTLRLDARHAGMFGDAWSYRVLGGYQQGDDFTRPRNAGNPREYGLQIPCTSGTYNCLPIEAVPLALRDVQIGYGGLRVDREFDLGRLLTFEVGGATLEGPTFLTGIGRVQVTDVTRPWARVNFNTARMNVMAYYDARDANTQVALASGAGLFEDSSNIRGEIQVNDSFANDRIRLVGGLSANQQKVDTANPQGVHTLMSEAKTEDQQAVFGQAEIAITDDLKLVAAARWDDSTLHEAQFSPKAALVYTFNNNHAIRANYNQAFQVPNYSEFFLAAFAGAPINLSAIENALRPALGGVPLNFSVVPLLARGNPNLEVETIDSWELGYSGILGGKLYFTADYYQNKVENFVTDLLPGVDPLTYPAYRPPAALSPAIQSLVISTLRANLPAVVFAGLSNLPNGNPAVFFTYTNAGKVETEGVELGLNFYVTNNWIVDASYSWFDFEVQQQLTGDRLLPNAPENKYNVGVTYRNPRFDVSLKNRWVEGFEWATGVFVGPIPDYQVASLSGGWNVSEDWKVGLNISNAFNDEHYEAFGGDLLSRRALGFVSYSW
ncbi:MAG TPA: TonB-dependent receptor [Thermoanaerobaculia bacterium]|nr:TonB-dependent receptor [Thermoanaerobaculia bacterium]